jgi:hypothetical protein
MTIQNTVSVHPDIILPGDKPSCQCSDHACTIGGPCQMRATQEDMLCDTCRTYRDKKALHCHFWSQFTAECSHPSLRGIWHG